MPTKKQDTTIPPLPWIEVSESSDWWINTDNDEAFDGGFVCESNPGTFRNQATLEFMLRTVNAFPALYAALNELVNGTPDKQAWDAARAALAAAHGEQQ